MIFIMCQGEQRRMRALGHPKQLIPINGEPLLHRTLRMLRDLGHEHPIVIGSEKLIEGLEEYSNIELADPGYCVLDGMAQLTVGLDGPVVFLLGDVIWSRAALTSFLRDTRPEVFAGTRELSTSGGEVFGCKFADQELLKRLLETAPCRFRPTDGHRIQYPQQQGGHLRRLYWHLMDDVRRRTEQMVILSRYLVIDDWTDDIDEMKDLKWIPEIEKLARLEAERKVVERQDG